MGTFNVCVIGGAGYVGLITGLCLGEAGHRVVAVDVDPERICQLQRGESPIYEQGVASLLKRNLKTGLVKFSTDLPAAVASAEIVFIAVGTPSKDDGQADLTQIIRVTEELEQCIDGYKLIVIKSTVPVGTVELVRSILNRKRTEGRHFDIVVNPEFLREGSGIHDFFYPDRIVIGTSSERALNIMRDLYYPVIQGQVSLREAETAADAPAFIPLVETDPATAQMIKYASSAFLATRISFINDIAGLCEKVGADIKEVSCGMGYDPRIGHAYLNAGVGFGGPCLEKDLRALMMIGESHSYETHLLRAVLDRNQRQIEQAVLKLKQLVGNPLYQKVVAVLGTAFKAGTDDTRNSLALKVIDRLEQEGVIVQVYDPQAKIDDSRVISCQDPYQAAGGADALMVLTEWPSFKDLDYGKIKSLMASPRIVDARNLLDAQAMRGLGFVYVGIGTA